MATNVVSLIHQQEAMLGQLGFLQNLVTTCDIFSTPEKIDQNRFTQLILTISYLKEGLQDLYAHEDNYLISRQELSNTSEIKYQHQAILNALHGIYRSLMDLNSKTPLTNESITDTIHHLCQIISNLSIQENEILQSFNN